MRSTPSGLQRTQTLEARIADHTTKDYVRAGSARAARTRAHPEGRALLVSARPGEHAQLAPAPSYLLHLPCSDTRLRQYRSAGPLRHHAAETSHRKSNATYWPVPYQFHLSSPNYSQPARRHVSASDRGDGGGGLLKRREALFASSWEAGNTHSP